MAVPVLLILFAVATRLSFTDHLDYHAEPEHELGNAAAWLASPNLAAPGPPIGFGADDRFDAGPAYSMVLSPFLGLDRSPFAIVWLHGAIAVMGLGAVWALARRESGLVGATVLATLYLASGSWLSAWEQQQWHCHAIVGLVAVQCWLARRVFDRPTAWRLGALFATGALTAQLYVAAGSLVLAHLAVLVMVARRTWRRELAADVLVGGLTFGLAVASPLALRLYATSASEAPTSTPPDAASSGVATVGDALGVVFDQLSPSWTLVRFAYGSGIVIAILAIWGLSTALRRRTPWDHFLAWAAAGTIGLGLVVFVERGEPRYLLGVAPVLFVLAAIGVGAVATRSGPALAARTHVLAGRGGRVGLVGVLAGVLAGPMLVPGNGGWVDRNVIPEPTSGERIGADLRLGLGEQGALVQIAHREWGWDFGRLCRHLHGLVCDAKHGIGSFAALLPPAGAPANDLDVLLEVPGSVMRVPDERRTGTRTMLGAFGRVLTFVSFEPAFDGAGIALERITHAGALHRCGDGLPFNSSYSTTVASKLYAASVRLDVPWSERPERCRGDDTASYRLWLPVRLAEGRAQVLVGYEGAEATSLMGGATVRRHGPEGPGPSEPVTLVSGGNEGDLAVVSTTWARGTVALELTLPGSDELKLVDAF